MALFYAGNTKGKHTWGLTESSWWFNTSFPSTGFFTTLSANTQLQLMFFQRLFLISAQQKPHPVTVGMWVKKKKMIFLIQWMDHRSLHFAWFWSVSCTKWFHNLKKLYLQLKNNIPVTLFVVDVITFTPYYSNGNTSKVRGASFGCKEWKAYQCT